MIKAVIFDMDGVIIDSEPIYHKVNKLIFKKRDLEITDEEYNDFIGGDDARLWSFVKNKFGLKESVEELLDLELLEDLEYFKTCEEGEMTGVSALLNDLKENGIKIGLASSSMRPLINVILERLEIKDYFETITSGDDVEEGKPCPDIFLLAAKLLGVKASDCLVIEDSANGVKAAKSAGMKCLGLLNPNSGNQDISKADKILNGLENVDAKLLKSI